MRMTDSCNASLINVFFKRFIECRLRPGQLHWGMNINKRERLSLR